MGSGSGTACDITLNTSLSDEERARWQDPDTIRRILRDTRTVAVVGLSTDPQKASTFVAAYLQYEGYRIIPVTPKGGTLLGERTWPDLASVPDDLPTLHFRSIRSAPAAAIWLPDGWNATL